MKQYIVNDPGRHGLQAMRQPDQASARRTRAPALLLVGHPENASWFGHLVKSRCQIGRRELLGPYGKRVVAFGADVRASRARTFSTMSRTNVCSSALDMRCGIRTTMVSRSRYAVTVRVRRLLRRTSTLVRKHRLIAARFGTGWPPSPAGLPSLGP
jgi:hypothetical protein